VAVPALFFLIARHGQRWQIAELSRAAFSSTASMKSFKMIHWIAARWLLILGESFDLGAVIKASMPS
jgi:hypothetical protein